MFPRLATQELVLIDLDNHTKGYAAIVGSGDLGTLHERMVLIGDLMAPSAEPRP